ncbi:lipase [Bacillus sp. CGMCC 1.60114]|uniref:lipase family protein n=1 Tax=unclassified Bacillus (in: firmicutes) TaxID=185979 RepID=UPI003636C7E9
MENNKKLQVASDWGKLELAGKDIYAFNKGEYPYNQSNEKNEEKLEANFNAKLGYHEVDKETGFAAYAFEDKKTGEIVISYVGTEDGTDAVIDAEIGGHNIMNANKIAFGNIWEHDFTVKQYDQGDAFYEKVKNENKGKKISITGHSLGGGIANTVALRHQKDDIDVLALNPAPVLNRDVEKYGDGFNMKNVRNIINENDPLHIGIKAADFTLPGRMYKIPNQAGHSYAFKAEDYDKNGHLIWIDKLASDNDTGWDVIPGFLELSKSTGALYTGTIHDVFKRKVSLVEESVGGEVVNLIIGALPIGTLLVYSDFVQTGIEYKKIKAKVEEGISRLNKKYEGIKSQITIEAIKFSMAASIEIKSTIDAAIDWIEKSLATCKEKVLEVLEAVFNAAVDFLVGCIMVYLSPGEIMTIAKEVASSLVDDILEMFHGDFVIDTNVTAIVGEHIRNHRQSLLNLFMADSRKGIDRSLLGEISKDVKELSKDLKQLNEDVSSAVVSMMAKDEELSMVTY